MLEEHARGARLPRREDKKRWSPNGSKQAMSSKIQMKLNRWVAASFTVSYETVSVGETAPSRVSYVILQS